MKTFIAILSLSLLSAVAQGAERLKTVAEGTAAGNAANIANEIVSVKYLKAGNYAYKLVSMNTELNGPVGLTTMVLVGEMEVGTEAGFEAAFQLTPMGDRYAVNNARVSGSEIVVTALDGNLKPKTVRIKYDPKTQQLIVR